jgi:quinolinate synthase
MERQMIQTINATTPLAEARAMLADSYDLKFSKAVEAATAPIFDRIRDRIPPVEWPLLAPLIFQINRLKGDRDAVILAHRYQTPQIFYGVADITGDCLELATEARRTSQQVLVQCSVHFMAETTKVLNPRKTVLIPDSRAGCSLAGSITPDDVAAIKARYPGAPVVAYVTSSAAVKAVADVCCTAANALDVIEAVAGNTVIMVPDQYVARNAARRTAKKIVAWAGSCEVHDGFTAADITELRAAFPTARIIAHPECPPEVVAAVDYAGSTDEMIAWVRANRPGRVVMVTECSMSDNLALETDGVEFVRGCNICPHMKRITLENILWSLHTMSEDVQVAPELVEPAARAIWRMWELAPDSRAANSR